MQPTIEQLAQCPQHFMQVATWIYNQWWRTEDNTIEVITSRLRDHLVPDRLPLTLVALADGRPVGSACMIFDDMEERRELSPWVAAVYVRPEFRKRRIGSALVRASVEKARALGIERLYLCTLEKRAFYARLGWSVYEENVGRHGLTVMTIEPRRHARLGQLPGPHAAMDTDPPDAALAVLAGGQSRRMGFPKAELRIGTKPILEYLLERFQWPGPTLLITAPGREHPTGWERFSRHLVDPVADAGPLQGIATALESLEAPCLLVTTVDMPAIEPHHLSWLIDQLNRRPEAMGVMCRRHVDDAERIEPFPSAYRPGALPLIRQRLANRRRSVHGLLDNPSFLALDAPSGWPPAMWTNLNYPQDVAGL